MQSDLFVNVSCRLPVLTAKKTTTQNFPACKTFERKLSAVTLAQGGSLVCLDSAGNLDRQLELQPPEKTRQELEGLRKQMETSKNALMFNNFQQRNVCGPSRHSGSSYRSWLMRRTAPPHEQWRN